MWRWFTCGFSTPPPCTARVDEGIRVRVTGLRLKGLTVHYLSFSVVVVGVEDRPPLGDLGRALRRRPTLVLRGHLCGILLSIMPVSCCPASRTGVGPTSISGSTARLRTNPTSSRAQRRDAPMLLASRSSSLPRHMRVPFETRHKADLTAPVLPVLLPECTAARTIPPSTTKPPLVSS